MTTPLSLVSCPQCLGSAVIKTEGGSIQCLQCNGLGKWLVNEAGQSFYFSFPSIESVKPLPSFPYKTWLRQGLLFSSFFGLSLSSVYILTNSGFNPFALVWKDGIANFIFSLSGFGSMYSLATRQSEISSIKSLHNLDQDSKNVTQINLFSYSNSRVKDLLRQAAQVAGETHQSEVSTPVLLITLLQQPRIKDMFARLEVSAGQVKEQIKTLLAESTQNPINSVTYHESVRSLLYAASQEALAHTFPYIDLEDIILAISKIEIYKDLFNRFGITYDELYAVSRWYAADEARMQEWNFALKRGRARPKGFMNRAWTALPTQFLDSYSSDITRLAANGNVRAISIRQAELSQILQTLGRTQKNNVLLLGEPGVGKNTLLGGLALKMIREEVPEVLKDKRLVNLDLGALLSGGDSAEYNIQRVLGEVAQAGNVILAIEDIQTLVGTSGKTLDAASLLSTALNKGYIQVITTATYSDYHRYVESNPTLASLLEIIEIKEATPEQTIQILEEEAPSIEHRQQVWLTYPAIEAAATLAKKYLPEKILPDSAIGLLDEAASSAKLANRQWVLKNDIEKTIEQKTGIPVQQATEKESELLLNLESELHKRLIGQNEAVVAIANSLRRARAGLHEGNKPISSFLFVGPTGVGKTETAKILAELYFGNQQSMIRLDMSEYQDNRAIYKLIGAPAASSESYTEGGTLTQAVREHPFSLILLDELEKADPSVLNLFLQLLDDGRLTENTGRTVYFNNTIIIATSNAGTSDILQTLQQGLPLDQLPGQIIRILQSHFKPEFLNRFDGIIPFHPLSPVEVRQVVTLMLQELTTKLSAQKYSISFAPETIEMLAQIGYDPLFGARPLRRTIQEKVEGLLAQMILEKSLIPGQILQITPSMIH